ncbi:MAG: hypothetical protein PHR35_14725 [Kiritimatiellae bacterium]|nr:hypothetical protein [Kiritimatiellia bacterium]
MEPVTDEVEAESQKPGAYIAARHRNPQETGAAAAGAGNYMVAGICALAAAAVYVIVLALLWLDWQTLQSA